MTTTRQTASEAYQEQPVRAREIARRIAEHLETVAAYPAEPIHWGHVGSMEHIAYELQATSDFIFQEGEYAD